MGTLLAIAMLIVSVALGLVTFRQFDNKRHGKIAGWAVGVAAMFIFQVLADPVRDRLRRDECAGYSGEDFAACMDAEPREYPTDSELGLL